MTSFGDQKSLVCLNHMFSSGVGSVKGKSDGVWVPSWMARFNGTDSCKRPPLRLCFLYVSNAGCVKAVLLKVLLVTVKYLTVNNEELVPQGLANFMNLCGQQNDESRSAGGLIPQL